MENKSLKLFTLLLSNISAGPQYVMGILEKMLGTVAYPTDRDRYIAYLDLIQAHKNSVAKKHYSQLSFLCGFLCERSAAILTDSAKKGEMLTLSIEHYQTSLSIKGGHPDTAYFAQWHIGMIKQQLGTDWSEVMESFLAATPYDLIRGEAIRDILEHFYAADRWRISYIFSSYGLKMFFGKSPAGERNWDIDPVFYNWKILEYHVVICLALRKKEEVATVYKKLTSYAAKNHFDMTPADILRIRSYQPNVIAAVTGKAPTPLKIPSFYQQPVNYETLRAELHL